MGNRSAYINNVAGILLIVVGVCLILVQLGTAQQITGMSLGHGETKIELENASEGLVVTALGVALLIFNLYTRMVAPENTAKLEATDEKPAGGVIIEPTPEEKAKYAPRDKFERLIGERTHYRDSEESVKAFPTKRKDSLGPMIMLVTSGIAAGSLTMGAQAAYHSMGLVFILLAFYFIRRGWYQALDKDLAADNGSNRRYLIHHALFIYAQRAIKSLFRRGIAT